METGLFNFALGVFIGFFAIMNPIANTPIFLSLTDGRTQQEKKKIALSAALTAFFIVAAFVFGGKYIFELFGITIPAFKLTGGILIFYVGFEMLQSKKSTINRQNEELDEGIAISPLAIPILAGPGTIVTAMNFVTNANYIHVSIVLIVFAAMVFLTYLAFAGSDYIVKWIGNNLITVIGKLMGLILAIMGVGMLIEGIKLAFNL
jgi:multiple antibiotic resistance protein